jgi:hypothetical protein
MIAALLVSASVVFAVSSYRLGVARTVTYRENNIHFGAEFNYLA